MTNYEMNAEMMGEMVEDWMFDHQEEMADLVLDGKPYYDDELTAWVQECHDNTTTYVLVDYNGSLDIQYVGTI